MDRRVFLKTLAQTMVAGAGVLSGAEALAAPYPIFERNPLAPQALLFFDVLSADRQMRDSGFLVVKNLEKSSWQRLSLGLKNPHMLIENPRERNQIVIPSFYSNELGLYDIRGLKLLKKIVLKQGYFNGHGAISPDGQRLYVSAYDLSVNGQIIVYAAQSLEEIKRIEYPTFFPHEILLSADGSEIIATNVGYHSYPNAEKVGASSVVVLDALTGAMKENYPLDDPHKYAVHLLALGNGDVVVLCEYAYREVSQYMRGANSLVALLKRGQGLRFLKVNPSQEGSLSKKTLQAAYHPASQVLAVSDHRPTGQLSFWSLQEERLLSVAGIVQPTGVLLAPSQTQFIVPTVEQGIYFVSTQDLTITDWQPAQGVLKVEGHSKIV